MDYTQTSKTISSENVTAILNITGTLMNAVGNALTFDTY